MQHGLSAQSRANSIAAAVVRQVDPVSQLTSCHTEKGADARDEMWRKILTFFPAFQIPPKFKITPATMRIALAVIE
ncbi:hypothetical protein PDE_04153 [Penicillium oxalicum 114-2]|uniref:Uncharacterized protein n=1 Tax=Penicillium oxalicum (strain 114-2 / CGMCC 5302) TaxID=933388 RepID=S7ZG06_PENO1|nr:hypothetical protein PDE_04153 [Penicillium oxalicum 114-2]